MALTPHQKTVMNLLHKNGGIVTKTQVCEVITFYCNTEKHVGNILSRMVKANLLKREKPGVFIKSSGIKQEDKDPNQTEIF